MQSVDPTCRVCIQKGWSHPPHPQSRPPNCWRLVFSLAPTPSHLMCGPAKFFFVRVLYISLFWDRSTLTILCCDCFTLLEEETEACLILNEGSTKEKKSAPLFCLENRKIHYFLGKALAYLTMPHWIGPLKGGRMLSFKDCDALSVRWVHSCLSLMSLTYFWEVQNCGGPQRLGVCGSDFWGSYRYLLSASVSFGI